MRVTVVSDVHGATAELARAADDADALLCLGDLVLFLDYDDLARGIFGELFGVENAREFVRLRTARRYQEASRFGRGLWHQAQERLGMTRAELLEQRVRTQYEALFAALPEPAYLTYGNVDVPAVRRTPPRWISRIAPEPDSLPIECMTSLPFRPDAAWHGRTAIRCSSPAWQPTARAGHRGRLRVARYAHGGPGAAWVGDGAMPRRAAQAGRIGGARAAATSQRPCAGADASGAVVPRVRVSMTATGIAPADDTAS